MNAKQYIREIIERSCLPGAERKRIKKDLENEIFSAIERGESIELIIERMGSPDEIAAGLYENYIDIPTRPFREYKSKKTLFGLPLIHIIRGNYASVPAVRAVGGRVINIGGRYGVSQIHSLPTARGVFAFGPKAKGIVAVGNLSAGFISIGNLSAGIISIGNISAGLFSIGNLVLALFIAFGNAAAGLLSAGNLVIGYCAAGNLALGKFAIGNMVKGVYTFTISNLSAQLEQIKDFIARLDAPAFVKAFFSVIEQALRSLSGTTTTMPLFVTFLAILLAISLLIIIIQNKLLK